MFCPWRQSCTEHQKRLRHNLRRMQCMNPIPATSLAKCKPASGKSFWYSNGQQWRCSDKTTCNRASSLRSPSSSFAACRACQKASCPVSCQSLSHLHLWIGYGGSGYLARLSRACMPSRNGETWKSGQGFPVGDRRNDHAGTHCTNTGSFWICLPVYKKLKPCCYIICKTSCDPSGRIRPIHATNHCHIHMPLR